MRPLHGNRPGAVRLLRMPSNRTATASLRAPAQIGPPGTEAQRLLTGMLDTKLWPATVSKRTGRRFVVRGQDGSRISEGTLQRGAQHDGSLARESRAISRDDVRDGFAGPRKTPKTAEAEPRLAALRRYFIRLVRTRTPVSRRAQSAAPSALGDASPAASAKRTG